MKLDVRHACSPIDAKSYDTARLRSEFLIESVFEADEAHLTYSHFDRIIVGGIMPVTREVALEGSRELASAFFLQGRELGTINVGGPGRIAVDGKAYPMSPRDGLYVGMGARELVFASDDPANPARFYLHSATAHTAYPTVKIDIEKAARRPLGSEADCNKRTIYQYIHPSVLQTCQLCMGLTQLEPGSCWNTMPTHTHDRRMEVYLYLDVAPDALVFHMMGQPDETRHIVVRNHQAVISPSWSIHSGAGTRAYAFIWGMAGENKDFDDMDAVAAAGMK